MRFMCLPDEFCGADSKFVIVPVPYEGDVTFGHGACVGPAEIIKASEHLEYYDEELGCEPFVDGIRVVDALHCSGGPDAAHAQIVSHVGKFVDKFVIGLGGDHSISSAFVEALFKKHPDLSVLILDAHSDLRYSWNNSVWNHACVSRRIAERHKVGIIGVRSMDGSENEFLDSDDGKNVKVVKAYEIKEENIKDVLNHLTDTVFISVDVDVFDPSFIRNTGTPEPGGLLWYDVLKVLKAVFKEKNVVGCDVVEFAPVENFSAEAFALAKIVYKIVGYKGVY